MGGRPRFLRFVREGTQTGWDAATRNHYGMAGVRELDRAWRLAQGAGTDTDPAQPTRDPNTVLVRAQSPSEPARR